MTLTRCLSSRRPLDDYSNTYIGLHVLDPTLGSGHYKYAEYQYVCTTAQIEAKDCFSKIDMFQVRVRVKVRVVAQDYIVVSGAVFTSTCSWTCVCVHACACVYMYVCNVPICICVCMCMCACVYLCVCVCVYQLFDLVADPYELYNVYNTTDKAITRKLAALLHKYYPCKGTECP